MSKLREDISISYSEPRNKCDYWEVFKKLYGETGYNYWHLIVVVPSQKGFIVEYVLTWLEVTMIGFGRRMASWVQDGRFGAYTVYED